MARNAHSKLAFFIISDSGEEPVKLEIEVGGESLNAADGDHGGSQGE